MFSSSYVELHRSTAPTPKYVYCIVCTTDTFINTCTLNTYIIKSEVGKNENKRWHKYDINF